MNLIHLMGNPLAACGGSSRGADGYLHTTPVLRDVTCPDCLRDHVRIVIESDHAEALAENIAHDAAMTMAITLPAELLPLLGARARQMPRTLRNRIDFARHMIVVPPHRHA
jgi:hypothetical protein